VEQIIAVHIDNGFLRKNESDAVEQSLVRLGLNIQGKFSLIELLLTVISSFLQTDYEITI
jgi:GMP synthase PP-ATPase subunit